MIGNFIYVENAAVAHLLYEQRLIELSNGGTNPDIGGQAFIVTDPNPPPTYGDVYLTMSTLTDGETSFPWLSPTFIILLGVRETQPALVSALILALLAFHRVVLSGAVVASCGGIPHRTDAARCRRGHRESPAFALQPRERPSLF